MSTINLFRRAQSFVTRKSNGTLLLLLWLLSLLSLALSQIAGSGLGLDVGPTGEDRVWIDLLSKPGTDVFKSWWSLNSRNPLAPWWYEFFSPLIHTASSGLYLARKALDLFLAVSIMWLFTEINLGKRRWLALAAGVLVLFWNFSGYVEQVMFVMLIALGFSILSIACYVRYLNSQRAVGEYLALSLLAFLIALGTYTIQCGVPLAVAILGVAYGRRGLPLNSKDRFGVRCAIELSLFAAIFVIFMQIWVTTSGPTSSFFRLDTSLFLAQFSKSLANLLWHADTTALLLSLMANWSGVIWGSIAVIGAMIFFRLFSAVAKSESAECPAEALSRGLRHPIALLMAVCVCLVAPTIALETTSTIWYPGSRSRMVQQIFQPVLYLCGAYLLVTILRKPRALTVALQTGSAAALCAFALVIGAEYNRQLVQLSAYERGLVSGLQKLVPAIAKPTHFFVRIDNADWYGGRNAELNRILVQQAYKSSSVWLNAIFRGAPDPKFAVSLGPTEQGVFSPATQTKVPYSQSIFVSYDGKNVSLLTALDEKTYAGYQARFERTDSHVQDSAALSNTPSCPSTFDFDVVPSGQGWSVPEKAASGDTFVWMAAKTATIELTTACAGRLNLSFRTLQPMTVEAQKSLSVAVDGKPLLTTVTSSKDGITEYGALLPADAISSKRTVNLTFTVDKVLAPQGGTRELAIPFDWIRVSPANPSTK